MLPVLTVTSRQIHSKLILESASVLSLKFMGQILVQRQRASQPAVLRLRATAAKDWKL